MNRSESKYYNTAILMDRALIELLAVKDIAYISVKEICEKAGVNRSTFYLHYETIGDLLEEAMEYTERQFEVAFKEVAENHYHDPTEAPLTDLVFISDTYLKPYLRFVYDHRAVYKASDRCPGTMNVGSRYTRLKKDILDPVMSRFNISERERKYWYAFYINGTWSLIREWIIGGCAESVDEMVRMIIKCVRPEIVNPLRSE